MTIISIKLAKVFSSVFFIVMDLVKQTGSRLSNNKIDFTFDLKACKLYGELGVYTSMLMYG